MVSSSVFYVFVVYILSVIMSALAQVLGNKTGYKNRGPSRRFKCDES
jgi:hypothetical protein